MTAAQKFTKAAIDALNGRDRFAKGKILGATLCSMYHERYIDEDMYDKLMQMSARKMTKTLRKLFNV